MVSVTTSLKYWQLKSMPSAKAQIPCINAFLFDYSLYNVQNEKQWLIENKKRCYKAIVSKHFVNWTALCDLFIYTLRSTSHTYSISFPFLSISCTHFPFLSFFYTLLHSSLNPFVTLLQRFSNTSSQEFSLYFSRQFSLLHTDTLSHNNQPSYAPQSINAFLHFPSRCILLIHFAYQIFSLSSIGCHLRS